MIISLRCIEDSVEQVAQLPSIKNESWLIIAGLNEIANSNEKDSPKKVLQLVMLDLTN